MLGSVLFGGPSKPRGRRWLSFTSGIVHELSRHIPRSCIGRCVTGSSRTLASESCVQASWSLSEEMAPALPKRSMTFCRTPLHASCFQCIGCGVSGPVRLWIGLAILPLPKLTHIWREMEMRLGTCVLEKLDETADNPLWMPVQRHPSGRDRLSMAIRHDVQILALLAHLRRWEQPLLQRSRPIKSEKVRRGCPLFRRRYRFLWRSNPQHSVEHLLRRV